MALMLFGIVMVAMTYLVCDLAIGINFRFDGRLFYFQRLQAKTKVHRDFAKELMFADCCAIVAHTEHCVQLLLNRSQSPQHAN